ncbi:MAG TPA: permease prefix domain 1-containing protein [Candidatus Limnocylindrales bacterium]|nr:permease prefix domain 1-containing protein [Candidatus Limnocylindrales bacterium]
MRHHAVQLPADVAARFGDHVETILANARVPAANRDELGEELRGHLVQAFAAGVADGLTADQAAEGAVAAFGGADVLGRELMATYRGRLWASTIGQLLPVIGQASRAPWPISWIVPFDRLIAAFSLVAAAAFLLTGSPLRAVLGFTIGVLAAAVIWLAATALRRGQRWAAIVSAYVCLINAVIFFVTLSPSAGGVNVSLNGLLGLVLLFALAANLSSLGVWLARSRPLPSPLGLLVGGVLVAWSVVAGTGGNLPDPSQIGPGDIRASAIVTCGPADGTTESGEPLPPAPTLDLRVTYDRVDPWPRGLLRDGTSWGDVIQLDVGRFYPALGEVRASGVADDGRAETVDVSVWAEVPAELSSANAQDQIVGEILGADQRAGRTIRVIIPTMPILIGDGTSSDDAPALDGIVASIRFHHLDRFTLRGFAECDKQLTLESAE